jgi:hypothetical protein
LYLPILLEPKLSSSSLSETSASLVSSLSSSASSSFLSLFFLSFLSFFFDLITSSPESSASSALAYLASFLTISSFYFPPAFKVFMNTFPALCIESCLFVLPHELQTEIKSLPSTFILSSGYLQFGQQTYFMMNLSSCLSMISYGCFPLMRLVYSILAPNSAQKYFIMAKLGTRKCSATSSIFTMLVFTPFSLAT